jgi:hypothetical protein
VDEVGSIGRGNIVHFYFMEELWELGPLLFFGDQYCLEEGTHLVGRSYT